MIDNLQKAYEFGKKEEIKESFEKVSRHLIDNLPYWEQMKEKPPPVPSNQEEELEVIGNLA